MDFFLDVSGLLGPSTRIGAEGAFNVASFSFGVSNSGSFSGGGAGVGKTEFQDLTLTFTDPSGLANFLTLLDSGRTSAMSLIGGSVGGDVRFSPTYRVDLAGAQVVSVLETTSGGNAAFQVNLHYNAIEVTEVLQKPDGSPAPAQTFSYDLLHNTYGGSVPDAIPSGAVAAAAKPHDYYMLIDGLNGGSTSEGHEHWFKIGALNFSASNAAVGGVGGGSGKPLFNTLSVHVDNDAGLSDLLTLLGTAGRPATLEGVRVEGVTLAGDDSQVVYKLDLGGVHVTGVTENSGGGYNVNLDYDRIQLVTHGIDSDGRLSSPNTFAWNLQTNSADFGGVPNIAPDTGHALPGHFNNLYLEVTGLGGASAADNFHGAFDILTYNFTGSRAAFPVNDAAANAQFSDLSVTFSNLTGLTKFLTLATSTGAGSAVSLIGAGGADNHETFRIDLSQAYVTNVSETSSGLYSVSLHYGAVQVTQQTQDQDTGQKGDPDVFSYNVLTHVLGDDVPDADPAGSSTPVAAPNQYYLLVDGLDGGSTDARHAGWFDIDAYNLGVNRPVTTVGSGFVAAKDQFSGLSVHVANEVGLTKLLSLLASGQHLDGVRLEGVRQGGDTAATVYRLDLGDVHVTNIIEDSAGGYSVNFAYDQIKLDTFGQKPTGQLDTPTEFTWNLTTNSANVSFDAISPTSVTDAITPDSFFLDMAGLDGPTAASRFHGAFDVGAFHFSGSSPVVNGGGGGAGAGKSSFSDLIVDITDRAGLTDFLKLVSTGAHTSASLIGAAIRGGAQSEVYRVNLADVQVSDVVETGHGYEVSLHYGAISLTQQTATTTGGLGTPQTFGYDIAAAQGGITVPNTPPGTTVAAGAAADNYYMLFDKVYGGSAEAHHVGWFNVLSFNLDVADPIQTGGAGGGAGKTTFGDLTVTVAGNAGVTDLLDAVARTSTVDGVRIEGVKNAADDDGVRYTLNLGGVHVTSVSPNSGGAYAVTLAYSRIQVVASSDDGASSTFNWNLALNNSDFGTPPIIAPGTLGQTNHAPIAVADAASVAEKASVTINVLANDTDQDAGDTKTLVSVSAAANGGHASIVGGQVVYAADADAFNLLTTGQTATDSFTYVMRDAAGLTSTASVTVTISGVADGPTQTGGTGNDSLTGTGQDERLDGGAGNDTLDGGAGTDTLVGGAGNDIALGGAGIDSISAGDGNDTIVGGAGNDVMAGARGLDNFVFGPNFGHDTVIDFAPGQDHLQFLGVGGLASFADVMAHASQAGANVIITDLAGDTVQLNNVQLSALHTGDFLFA